MNRFLLPIALALFSTHSLAQSRGYDDQYAPPRSAENISYGYADVLRVEILHARRRRNRETGRDGHAEICHLGEIRPFAAQKRLHVPRTVCFAVAEEIDGAGHEYVSTMQEFR